METKEMAMVPRELRDIEFASCVLMQNSGRRARHFLMSLFSCKQELQLPRICFEILNRRGRGWEGTCHGAASVLRPQSRQELQPGRPKLSNVKYKLIYWMDRRNLDKQQRRTGCMWFVNAAQESGVSGPAAQQQHTKLLPYQSCVGSRPQSLNHTHCGAESRVR